MSGTEIDCHCGKEKIRSKAEPRDKIGEAFKRQVVDEVASYSLPFFCKNEIFR